MPTDNKEVDEIEVNFKNKLFDKINKISAKQSKVISQIQKNGEYKDLEEDLPNIGITLNNKIIVLQHKFQKAGLSMYSQKHEEQGFVGASFIGDAIIEDLIDYVIVGNKNLDDCSKAMNESIIGKYQKEQMLEKTGLAKRLFAKIKTFFTQIRQEHTTKQEETTNKINEYLLRYKDTDSRLWNYDLKENIVSSIAKKIKQEGCGTYTVSEFLQENVIPDLQKLGLLDLVPQLQETLQDEYKKDYNLKSLKIEERELQTNKEYNKDNSRDDEI